MSDASWGEEKLTDPAVPLLRASQGQIWGHTAK
jgi:hypothetical protein